MLPKRILPKQFSTQNKPFGKYAVIKPLHLKQSFQQDDKQNQQNTSNIHHPTVDISKKIRKRSPKKYTKSSIQKIQKFNGFIVYKEDQLDLDAQLKNLIQPQRIDNDVDTDQEQMQSGINKMMNFLREGCMERMRQSYADDYQ